MVDGDFDEDDECCEMDSSEGNEGLEDDECDAVDYRRYQNVELVLPTAMAEQAARGGGTLQARLFWANTANNLERLQVLGLIEHCSLVVREVQDDEVVEVEVDASLIRRAHSSDVCGLRIRADVDTMCAHCADCPHCATTRVAASEEWSVWWSRALCLADYMCFLNAHNPPCEMMNNIQDVECDGGFDLSFLID